VGARGARRPRALAVLLKTRGGIHIDNRGAGIWRNYRFFETPDNYLVSLDARTGEERWHVEIGLY